MAIGIEPAHDLAGVVVQDLVHGHRRAIRLFEIDCGVFADVEAVPLRVQVLRVLLNVEHIALLLYLPRALGDVTALR